MIYMKFFKEKKGIIITVAIVVVLFFVIRHIMAENSVFYTPDYEKTDISEITNKEALSHDDYMLIFRQTGVSGGAAKEIIDKGDTKLLTELHSRYFKEPDTKKNYIAYPITLEERNTAQKAPIVPLKKGDILVTFNTRTLDWRHGHCGLVLEDGGLRILEHMSIGKKSAVTSIDHWGYYPAFAVLRHPDKDIAQNAVTYAEENLVGIDYDMFAGIFKKDKTDEENPSSHCSHIVWQAYKSQGVDIDHDGGPIVTPHDIAMSENLQVVQIFGLDPKDYTSRILK